MSNSRRGSALGQELKGVIKEEEGADSCEKRGGRPIRSAETEVKGLRHVSLMLGLG